MSHRYNLRNRPINDNEDIEEEPKINEQKKIYLQLRKYKNNKIYEKVENKLKNLKNNELEEQQKNEPQKDEPYKDESLEENNSTESFNSEEVETIENSEDYSSEEESEEDDDEEETNKTYLKHFVNITFPLIEKEEKLTKEKYSDIINLHIDELRDTIDSDFETKFWASGLSDEKLHQLKPEYDKISKMLLDEEPNIVKILESKLSDAEKKNCLQIYNMKTTSEPGSYEYYEYRNRLVSILEKASHRIKNNEFEVLEKQLTEHAVDKNSLKDRIFKLECSIEIKINLFQKFLRLESITSADPDYSTLKTQLEWALSLPYEKTLDLNITEDPSSFFLNVYNSLDTKLFGLKNVKQKLLLLLNNTLTSKTVGNKSIALCGKPGIGKTSIAKAFADSIGLPFESISLGGSKDSTMLYGSDNVYISSGPGIIVKTLKKMKCSNGIILFDEIDKIEDREMQYALLHITDFTQNKAFRDKYLSDIPIDISRIWFMFSMNDEKNLDKALKDRLNIIYLDDYSINEKKTIIKNYVLKEELKNLGFNENDVIIEDEVINKLLLSNKDENTGIRYAKSVIQELMSKINFYKTINNNSSKLEKCFDNILKIEFPFRINLNNFEKLINFESNKNLTYYM